MKELFVLLKKGNKSALVAAIVNTVISVIKGIAFFFTGNVAMFAETMHSLGDAANQLFVFIGSAFSKKGPTKRFPNGFGRLVNLVLLGAVLIVAIMSYETIKEGVHHLYHPATSTGFWINISVLSAAVILEFIVLNKAMNEILHESNIEAKRFRKIPTSFKHLHRAKPATKLVFMEDLVATLGGVVAISAITISHYTSFYQAEGIASILIGVMMFVVVGKVFLDNAAGALGEADSEMEEKIGKIVLSDPQVKDIQQISVIKEGEHLHIEVLIEVEPTLSIAEADDIKDRLVLEIQKEKGVTDIVIAFDEDDGKSSWSTRTIEESN